MLNMRRFQDLFIEHEFLAQEPQEVYARKTRSFTRKLRSQNNVYLTLSKSYEDGIHLKESGLFQRFCC
jgi:hypothetical protein